jgi:hypothetical protein
MHTGQAARDEAVRSTPSVNAVVIRSGPDFIRRRPVGALAEHQITRVSRVTMLGRTTIVVLLLSACVAGTFHPYHVCVVFVAVVSAAGMLFSLRFWEVAFLLCRDAAFLGTPTPLTSWVVSVCLFFSLGRGNGSGRRGRCDLPIEYVGSGVG